MFTIFRPSALLLLLVLPAAAQDWSAVKALPVGTSVRISIGSRTVNGQIQGITDDSLDINSGKGQEALKRLDVKRVDVKKQGHRGRNTLIGLGAGAAAGAIAGTAYYEPCKGFCILNPSRGQDAGIGAGVLGLVGAIVGALIPTGGWREVYKQ